MICGELGCNRPASHISGIDVLACAGHAMIRGVNESERFAVLDELYGARCAVAYAWLAENPNPKLVKR